MRDLKIRFPNQIIILKSVPFAHLQALEIMLEELQALWLKQEAIANLLLSSDSSIATDLCQKILNLHPRVDEPGKTGFDLTPLLDDLPQFEEVFFAVRNDDDRLDVFKGGLILQLNRFAPLLVYQKATKLLEVALEPSPPQETGEPIS